MHKIQINKPQLGAFIGLRHLLFSFFPCFPFPDRHPLRTPVFFILFPLQAQLFCAIMAKKGAEEPGMQIDGICQMIFLSNCRVQL
jgi:hypothetical protein